MIVLLNTAAKKSSLPPKTESEDNARQKAAELNQGQFHKKLVTVKHSKRKILVASHRVINQGSNSDDEEDIF